MLSKRFLKYAFFFILFWITLHVVFLMSIGLIDLTPNSGAILILGNKVEENGKVSQRLKSRLDAGLKLYEAGKAPLIIVSGGLGKEGFDEAEVMKKYLIEHQVPASKIIVDSQGFNTYSTAKNFAEIAKEHNIDSVISVSQYYHLARTKLALKKFGIENIGTAHAQMLPELRDLYSIPREVVGYYVYIFKDYRV